MTVFIVGHFDVRPGEAACRLMLGWDFNFSLWVSAVIVLVYIFLGGLTSAIYNEVLQFFLIVLGFLPLVFLGLRDVGGWNGLTASWTTWPSQPDGSTIRRARGPASGPPWARRPTTPWASNGSAWSMGLGFVLAFGYWCTDFLVVQRAMAAESMSAARRTPADRRDPQDADSRPS